MVHRAPPHPGHLAAGRPPDVGPDSPSRPAPAAIDPKRQCPSGQRVAEFPGWLAYIGQAVISAIYGPLAAVAYRPDTALVNYYDPGPRPWGGAVRSRLLMPYAAFVATKAAGASWKDRTPGNLARRPGQNLRIHHDNGETISDLAVSLSLGDRCSFRLSNSGKPGLPLHRPHLVFRRRPRIRTTGTLRLPRRAPNLPRHRQSQVRPHPRPDQHHNAHHRAQRSVSPEPAEFTRAADRNAACSSSETMLM